MATVELKTDVSLDQTLLFGGMVIDSLTEDVKAIGALFKTIDDAFLKALIAKHTQVMELIYPSQIIGKQAKLTKDIYAAMDVLPEMLNITEGQIKDASDSLKTLVKYFGISNIRKAIHNRDISGTIDSLNNFIQSINDKDNYPALELKGLTIDTVTTYTDIHTLLATLFQERVDLEKDRAALVDNNHIVINDYWADIKNVCDKGKRVFKKSNPTKVANYTIAKLMAKLKRDVKLNDIHGKITAKDAVKNKVFVELIPLGSGRRRTAKSKNGGLYEIGGIVPGKYILSATLKDYKIFSAEVEIKQGEKLSFDIELEEE